MTNELLIDAIVRQTTVLIAQLATANGARTPLAVVAEQVFADLVRELERQGVSRKVAADTLEVWPGHPLEAEALGELAALRQRLTMLRTKVATANEGRSIPERRTHVVLYIGQNVVDAGDEEES